MTVTVHVQTKLSASWNNDTSSDWLYLDDTKFFPQYLNCSRAYHLTLSCTALAVLRC